MKRRRRELGPPAEWGRLPHELIVEILSRLPAKTLLLFKLVSKRWCNLIRDPHFIKMHVGRAIKFDDGVSLFLTTEAHPTITSREFLEKKFYSIQGDSFDKCVQIVNPLDYRVRVLGSCDGLVCFGSEYRICLLNPVTRECKIVRFDKEFGFSNKATYGLGYDDGNDDYLVVEIVRTDNSYDLYEFGENDNMDSEVSVYSTKDTSRLKLANIPYRLCQGHGSGIYLNGYLHWLADFKVFSPKVILTFDGKEKVFHETPRPVNWEGGSSMSLGVLRGQLSILRDIYQSNMELWVMRSYGVADSWVKLYSIEKKYFNGAPSTKVLCYIENVKLLMKDGQKLVMHDLKGKQLWNLRYAGVPLERIHTRLVHVASLVSLKSGTYLSTIHGDKSGKKRKEKVDLEWFSCYDEEELSEEDPVELSEEDPVELYEKEEFFGGGF